MWRDSNKANRFNTRQNKNKANADQTRDWLSGFLFLFLATIFF
jgi:hypothetical protein